MFSLSDAHGLKFQLMFSPVFPSLSPKFSLVLFFAKNLKCVPAQKALKYIMVWISECSERTLVQIKHGKRRALSDLSLRRSQVQCKRAKKARIHFLLNQPKGTDRPMRCPEMKGHRACSERNTCRHRQAPCYFGPQEQDVRNEELDNHITVMKPDDDRSRAPPPARNHCAADQPADHSNAPGCSFCILTTCLHDSRLAIFSYHLATCFLAVKSFRPLSEELTM